MGRIKLDVQPFIQAAGRLKARRLTLGYSVATVTGKLGVRSERYRYWEKIFGPLAQKQYGAALARILEVDLDWILSDDESLQASTVYKPSLPHAVVDYEVLGKRAEILRIELGLSRAAAADAIGINAVTLKRWESCLPNTHRGVEEDAWEKILLVPHGWLRNPDIIKKSIKSIQIEVKGCTCVADEIVAVGAWLSRKRPIYRTLCIDDLTNNERRWADIFAERYGVFGPNRVALEAIGNNHGLTRERIRQIVESMLSRIDEATFALPRLNELVQEANQISGIPVCDFAVAHKTLLGPELALEDADRFGREVLATRVAKIAEGKSMNNRHRILDMVGTAGRVITIEVRDASMRLIRGTGAAHVLFVTGMVSESMGAAISLKDVRTALQAIQGVEWLDEYWYWFGEDTSKNRVLSLVRKVLAVADKKVDVEDLQQAIARGRRLFYSENRNRQPMIEAPRHIIKGILSRVSWLKMVQHDDFVLAYPVDMQEVLSNSEFAVVEMILKVGGAVSRGALTDAFVESGLFTLPNLQILLSGAPMIRSLDFGVYGLVGHMPTNAALTTAHSQVSKCAPTSIDDAGWVEFDLVITQACLDNRSIDFPSAVVKSVGHGEYSMEGDFTGTFKIGCIPSAPNRVTSLATIFYHAGVKAGDRLTMQIHNMDMRAMVRTK